MVDSKRNKKGRGNIENTIEGKWLKQKLTSICNGNFTDDSIILDIVQLPVKNHLFWDVSSDDLN